MNIREAIQIFSDMNCYGSMSIAKSVILNYLQDRHWIPVSENMPDNDNMCLVSCKTVKGVKSVNRAYDSGGFWHGSGSMSGVEAWMSLPEPYKSESEE